MRVVGWLKYWFWPQKPAPVEPDWSAIADYTVLMSAAAECGWMSPDAFLAGPFQRYLDLCGDGTANARGRARTMEFGRGSVRHYAAGLDNTAGRETDENRGRPLDEAGEAFFARARAMAADWFADKPDGDYMMEVLDGTATHNHRAATGSASAG